MIIYLGYINDYLLRVYQWLFTLGFEKLVSKPNFFATFLTGGFSEALILIIHRLG
jgi:hypothetical protein